MKPQPSRHKKLVLRLVGDRLNNRSWVFYGRSGTGKTTLSSTFPKPILHMDVNDQGTDSIADIKKVHVLDVEEWDEIEAAYWRLKQNPGEFKTVVIDTITQVQQLALKAVVKKSSGDKRIGDWGSMTKKDWGNAASIMKTWIDNYRDLSKPPNKGGIGIEVVFLAQDRIFGINEDEDDSNSQLDPEVGPMLMPSVVKHLNAVVSMIGGTFIRRRIKEVGKGKERRRIKKTEYCVRIGPNPIYITKMRKPKSIKLPDLIIDPSHEKFLEIIRGEV